MVLVDLFLLPPGDRPGLFWRLPCKFITLFDMLSPEAQQAIRGAMNGKPLLTIKSKPKKQQPAGIAMQLAGLASVTKCTDPLKKHAIGAKSCRINSRSTRKARETGPGYFQE